MKYRSFEIRNYRAIRLLTVPLDSKLVPLIGVNECGKTTILQAIYSFDHTNDEEYEGRHLNSVQNLYETVNKDASVTATVSARVRNVIDALNAVATRLTNGTLKVAATDPPLEFTPEGVVKLLGSMEKDITLKITRDLTSKTYMSDINLPSVLKTRVTQQQFAKEIVTRLPFILYNDDFADRPPSEVPIPPTQPATLNGWLAIYERLFKQTDPNYSVFSVVSEQDPRRRSSILSDVESHLSSTLTEAWKTFSADKKSVVKVSLGIDTDEEETKLSVQIVEEVNTRNRYFDVLDRSKGFVWYFNFIMKTQFNPKIVGKVEDTVFLLDEPGSYLHASAQDKLSGKLKEISEKFGIVIYCTHSHHLLNPESIPLKNIYIVEKTKTKSIELVSIHKYKSKSEKISALQPVLEALQLPFSEFFSDAAILLMVEGINDRYVLDMFLKPIDNLRVLPGTSADSIMKNIPYMIAYDKKFFCLWDNDEEGVRNQKRARKEYHIADESLLVLPLEGRSSRRMEDILTPDDYVYLRAQLELDTEASYDVIIPTLYFTERRKRTRICQGTSSHAKQSFGILETMLINAASTFRDSN